MELIDVILAGYFSIFFFFFFFCQVNLFTTVTCVAEFIGGGVQPWFRVDSFKLFADLDGFGFVTLASYTYANPAGTLL